MSTLYYDIITITLGLKTYEGDDHLFHDSFTHLLIRNQEYKEIIDQLEDHIMTLTSYMKKFMDINVDSSLLIEEVTPVNSFSPESIIKSQGFTMQGRENNKWVNETLKRVRCCF